MKNNSYIFKELLKKGGEVGKEKKGGKGKGRRRVGRGKKGKEHGTEITYGLKSLKCLRSGTLEENFANASSIHRS